MSFHIQKAHELWKDLLNPGDCAIDATCGNGYDALYLSTLVGKDGTLFCIDIQKRAIVNTRERLGNLPQAHYMLGSHEHFPEEILPKLIVYNLGYLPGGNKSVTTQSESTLQSIENGLNILQTGGMLSITCYPGHIEGARESSLIETLLASLSKENYSVLFHRQNNKPNSPKLNTVVKLK
jgi:hypothetical protein